MLQSVQGKVVFIGGPLTAHVDPVMKCMDPSVVQRYATVIEAFELAGYTVRNAHREEEWGAQIALDVHCTKRDYEWMESCDLFVAFPGCPPSPGVHVELGWATALGISCVVLTESSASYAKLVTGLPSIGNVVFLRYTQEPEFFERLLAQAALLCAAS